MSLKCQNVTSTSVPIVKYIKNNFIKLLYHEAYEREYWFRKQNNKAHNNAQNAIKNFFSCYIPMV